MRQNRVRIYLHFVWTTLERRPLLTEDIRRRLYRNIEAQAQRMGCDVLAVGGVADHVHLAVRVPATLDIPKLMQQVKGVSSAFARDVFGPDRFFRWQDGYGVFSFHALQAERVIAYIERQQQRHAENRLWPEWEDPDEEPPSA